ncbi:MAG TPA: hypothetical protein VIR16_06595 [Candidatus Limnocylindrales bacterium]
MSKTQDTRFADSEMGRLLATRVQRPKALLVAEVYLVLAVVAVVRLVLGALLVPGFLASTDNVPPFVVDAQLTVPLAVAALGLPICLAPLAIAGTRLPGRVPWSWTLVAALWLVIAFAEMVLASADFTATVFLVGAIPAALIGSSLVYLRRVAGQPWKVRWSRRRTVAITAVVVLVSAFWALYLISGVLGMDFRFVMRYPTFWIPGGG